MFACVLIYVYFFCDDEMRLACGIIYRYIDCSRYLYSAFSLTRTPQNLSSDRPNLESDEESTAGLAWLALDVCSTGQLEEGINNQYVWRRDRDHLSVRGQLNEKAGRSDCQQDDSPNNVIINGCRLQLLTSYYAVCIPYRGAIISRYR